jgi:hypothetical protein
MGLISGKEFADNSFHTRTNRRQVYHNYPQGAAPLMGLLSLTDTEAVDTTTNFGWEEKRYRYPRTLTANADSGTGAFAATSSGAAIASAFTAVINTVYYVNVDSASDFQINDSIVFMNLPLTSGIGSLRGVITAISGNEIGFRATHGLAAITNTAVSLDIQVCKMGSAYGEGSRSGSGRVIIPVNPQNNTQIFKDGIEFTGSALKIPTDFDKTGLYKEKSKDTALDHQIGQEFQFLLGMKSSYNQSLASGGAFGGSTTPVRTTGGILYFLEEWEKADGGTIGYRPGEAALTADTDDDKRIIENSTGTLTRDFWDTLMERAFRKANNKSQEKICFCGNGALKAVNRLIELGIVTQVNAGSTDTVDSYGMRIKTVETTWGVLHFKSHPLMTDLPELFYAMFVVDVPFLKFRPLNDRDMTLLPNRQDNDEDGRKDVWLTEAGLELVFPEAHMLIKNVQKIVG